MTGILNALIAGVSGAVKDTYFNLVSLLLPGNGTDGANNNFFLDSSSNNFTITRNPTSGPNAPTQGTFSPFSQTGWGNYFVNASNQYLSLSSSSFAFGTGAFTIEAWVYLTSYNFSAVFSTYHGTNTGQGVLLGFNNTGQVQFNIGNAGGGGDTTVTTSGSIALNTWVFVQATKASGSGGAMTIYVNGTSSGTTTTTRSIDRSSATIGRYYPDIAGNQVNGYLSNVRVSNTVRSSTVPIAPFTNDANTILLTCQSNRFLDVSSTPITITANNSPSVVAFSPFAPTAAYTTAAVGGSGYFDGTGDFLSATNASALQLTSSTAFTIEFWWYPTSLAAQQYVQSAWVVGSTGYAIATGVSSFTVSELAFFDGTTWRKIGNPVVNAWNHIAIVSSGTSNTGYLYLNGSPSAAFTVASTINYTSGTWYLGQNSSSGAYANGYVTDFRLLKGTNLYPSGTAFTPPTAPLTAIANTSLLLNFTNAGITDATAKNDLETVGNAQISTTQSKWGGGSIALDGTGDYLLTNGSVTDLLAFGTGDFCIEMWVNFSSLAGTPSLLDARPASTNGAYVFLYANGSSSINLYVSSAIRITGTVSLSTGVWYHVAVARSGGSTRLYVAGNQVGSTYSDTTSYLGAAGRPAIGTSGSVLGNDALNGYIDDLRITKGNARGYTGSTITVPTAPFPVQ